MSMPGQRHPGGTGGTPGSHTYIMERRSDAYLDLGTLDDTGPRAVVRDPQCRRRTVWVWLWLWGVPHTARTPTGRREAHRRRRERTTHAAVRHVGRCSSECVQHGAGHVPALFLVLAMILSASIGARGTHALA